VFCQCDFYRTQDNITLGNHRQPNSNWHAHTHTHTDNGLRASK